MPLAKAVDCARHLIAAGADPDLEDPERITPLNMALLNLHFEFAAFMIKAGADVNKWDLFGRSPLYLAADTSTLPTKGNGAMAVIPSEDSVTALDIGACCSRRAPIRICNSSVVRRIATFRKTVAAIRSSPRARHRCCARRERVMHLLWMLLQTQRARRSAQQGRRHAAHGGGRR